MKNAQDDFFNLNIDEEAQKKSKDLLKKDINSIFSEILKDEKKILCIFFISFFTLFLIINIFFYFFIDLDKFNRLSLDFIIVIDIVYLLIGFILYTIISNYMMDMKIKINILYKLQLRNEKDLLSARVIENIAEHLNHEIKPSLLSIKNLLNEYHNILNILKLNSKKDGAREIDKILFGEKDKDPQQCLHCKIFNKKSKKCLYYSWYGKPLNELLDEYQQLAKISLNQIQETLRITQNLKSLKKDGKDISIYSAIEQSVSIFNMVRKYKFDYIIDEKLKNCFLNGLPSEILSNIILNHIKNSLEAKATLIIFNFKGYIEKDSKKFIYFEIQDNGRGIPKNILDHIYKLNFTTKNISILNDKNSGVGLYLIKQILNYYSGDEKVSKTTEEGTTFCIRIPVKNCKINLTEDCKCCSEMKKN